MRLWTKDTVITAAYFSGFKLASWCALTWGQLFTGNCKSCLTGWTMLVLPWLDFMPTYMLSVRLKLSGCRIPRACLSELCIPGKRGATKSATVSVLKKNPKNWFSFLQYYLNESSFSEINGVTIIWKRWAKPSMLLMYFKAK